MGWAFDYAFGEGFVFNGDAGGFYVVDGLKNLTFGAVLCLYVDETVGGCSFSVGGIYAFTSFSFGEDLFGEGLDCIG